MFYINLLLNTFIQCTGNHEFDNGASGLQSPFLDNATFPVLACNLNITDNPELKARIQSHVVLIVGGEKIGVIGYITAETQFLVRKGKYIHSTVKNTCIYSIKLSKIKL